MSKKPKASVSFKKQDTKQNYTFLSFPLFYCFVLIICDFFFAGMVLMSKGTKEDIPTKPKHEYDLQFEGKIEFKSDFHRHMHKFSEAHSFSVFMLLVIVANCGILIAMTFEVVVVRGGQTVWFHTLSSRTQKYNLLCALIFE